MTVSPDSEGRTLKLPLRVTDEDHFTHAASDEIISLRLLTPLIYFSYL